MAKRRSLLKELSTQDVQSIRPGTKDWRTRFEQDNPEDYAAIKEAIEDWLRGGTMKALFSSRSCLHRYLSGKHPTAVCDPAILPPIALITFTKLVEHIEGGLDGKAKAS